MISCEVDDEINCAGKQKLARSSGGVSFMESSCQFQFFRGFEEERSTYLKSPSGTGIYLYE